MQPAGNPSHSQATVNRLPPIALLIAISALGPVVLNGVIPANSAIMREFSAEYAVVQLVLPIFLIASLVAQLTLGPLADRIGRRPVMMGALLVFAAGSIWCALANSVELLLCGRFVQGLGASVCVFLPRTIVRDVYARDRAASFIGYMTTAMMVAPLFGPAVGGWITDQFHWRWMYAWLAAMGFIMCLLAWRYQHETRVVITTDSLGTPDLTPSPLALFGSRAFLCYAFTMTGSVGIYYSVLSGAPYLIIERWGFSASEYGIWFAVVAVGYLLGNLVAGLLSERLGVERMIRWGLVPMVVGVVLFWLLSSWHHPLGLFIPMQLVAFSNGLTLPNMTSAAMSVIPGLAGSASGIAGSLQTGFGILMSLLMGSLLPFNGYWLHGLLTVSASIALIALWLLPVENSDEAVTADRH